MPTSTQPAWIEQLLTFWFDEIGPAGWYGGGTSVDDLCRGRFGELLEQFRADPPVEAEQDAKACLALILLYDQLSRNIHRGTAGAFAADALALELANLAIAQGWDQQVPESWRGFFYMPLMHAEDLGTQQKSVEIFRSHAGGANLPYARSHAAVIERFGRFPHRNRALDRESTPEELDYLTNGDSWGQ